MDGNGNNIRQRLLETWTYPGLSQSILGIQEMNGPGVYGGRIQSIGPFTLSWGGKDIEMTLEDSSFDPPEYQLAMGQGDLVAVTVLENSKIKNIKLLAPCGKPPFRISWEQSQKWDVFVQSVRQFFQQNDFLEVRTPSLVSCPGTEPYLKPFSLKVKSGSSYQEKFLPTSPELNLKKYLVAGHTRIFEFKECFRNDENTSIHRPEFLMLEWYRAFANVDSIVEDLKKLIFHLSVLVLPSPPTIRSVTIYQLFQKHLRFEFRPNTSKEELQKLCQSLGISGSATDSWDELFFRIFLEKIEPHLMGDAWIVRDYPPQLAAYSRILPSGWADRFEFYWGGLEIANAFHELNHPQIQRQRMEEDNKRKLALGLEAVPLDEEFLEGLSSGLPPSGGIALGMERLFMALYALKHIDDVPFRIKPSGNELSPGTQFA